MSRPKNMGSALRDLDKRNRPVNPRLRHTADTQRRTRVLHQNAQSTTTINTKRNSYDKLSPYYFLCAELELPDTFSFALHILRFYDLQYLFHCSAVTTFISTLQRSRIVLGLKPLFCYTGTERSTVQMRGSLD